MMVGGRMLRISNAYHTKEVHKAWALRSKSFRIGPHQVRTPQSSQLLPFAQPGMIQTWSFFHVVIVVAVAAGQVFFLKRLFNISPAYMC